MLEIVSGQRRSPFPNGQKTGFYLTPEELIFTKKMSLFFFVQDKTQNTLKQ